MRDLKNKVYAFAVSLALAVSAFTPAVFAEDIYTAERDAASVTETQNLYGSRPVTMRQMENLDRGVVAVASGEGTLVTWRMLGTDSADISFNVYRDGQLLSKTAKTNYLDKNAPKTASYQVVPIIDEKEDKTAAGFAITQADGYISIPVKTYEKGDYIIDDASVGDLDGDGVYEIVVRRNPKDMALETRVAYPIIEAYTMDGKYLWTIDIGPNEINDIDINFLVYDFDGDGKSEVVTRSFEGTTDGTGQIIGDVNGDGKTNYEYSIASFPDRQYLSEGPEFLSIYEGKTGKELARTEVLPKRDPLQPWGGYKEGDARNVKRANHFLLTTAYLDGVTPSIVMVRGCWNAVGVAAWNYKDSKLTNLWELPITSTDALDNIYNGGYHSIAVADVDFDGKDEILSGSMAIDDNGKMMYCTNVNGVKLGHGDAFDVAMMSKDQAGYLVWSCQENKGIPVNIGLHDARTGQVLLGFPKPKDTGRARAADIDPTNPGWEVWGSTGTPLMGLDGTVIATNTTTDGANAGGAPVSMNMKLYWDGDLLSELFDYTSDGKTPRIEKWNWEKKVAEDIWTAQGCSTNGGTKGHPSLIADIYGDWREEVVVRTDDNKELRIYSTAIPTDYRMPTLMHDATYRESVAWQNNHYNQPTNVSYYMGAEMTEVPVPEIYTIDSGTKKVNPVFEKEPQKHAVMPVLVKEEQQGSLSPLAKPLVLKLGNAKALVEDVVVPIDKDNSAVVPFLQNDRTLVPMRFLAETFGAKVKWDNDTRTVTLTKSGNVIVMAIDATVYTINGEQKELDCPAVIVEGRTFVPLRAISESFNKKVHWDQASSSIVISDNEIEVTAENITEWNTKLG